MPPQVINSSDSDSEEEVIQSTKRATKKEKTPAEEIESDDDGANAEGSDNESNEYTVEAIMDHKFAGDNDDELFFHVKWQDYPSKKDWTWEPEEHLTGGSDVILQEYYKSIGGRPVQKPPKSASRKRGRASLVVADTTPIKSTKKPRTSIAASMVGTASPDGTKVKTVKDRDWKPPAGNWEDQIANIDTIEKTEDGLICYVQWDNGRKSQHDINVVYKKCPQRMLTFYEQHLVFKETGTL